jgi:branched-chain amino acid transport system permease protein
MHPPPYLAGHVMFGGRDFPTYRSFLIAAGAVLVTLLWLGLDRTRLGAKIRAAVDNRRMAQSVGIDTSGLFSFTFALGTGLAALGGALGAEILPIFPAYSLDNLILFLIVVSVGGLGTIRGPFFAALLLGISDTAFTYLLPQTGSFFIYALTLVVLLWRPKGLFGQIGRV